MKNYIEGFFDNIYIKIIIIIIIIINKSNLNKKNRSSDKISVIIPTYNRAHLILRSVNSVLNQTYQNIEVLIIDDGSVDNTSLIINQLENNKIKYFKLKENRGGSFARNYGILKSSGKYIAFQDSDDYYHPDKLEKQYNNLKRKKSDLDFCKINLHFNKTDYYIFPDYNQEKNIKQGKVVNELCRGNFISTQSILVKKKYIEKYLFDIRFRRLQDFDLILRMIPKLRVSYTEEVLADLFREKDSIGNSKEKYFESLNLLLNKKYDIKCDIRYIYNLFKNNTK